MPVLPLITPLEVFSMRHRLEIIVMAEIMDLHFISYFFHFKQCLRWFSSAASSGLLWFYALAPNNSSIALASMQAAATSNSERFSPRRCRARRHKPRAVRLSSSPVSAAQPPGEAAPPQAAVVRRRRVGGAPPIGSPAFKPGTATWPSVSAAMSRCCLDSH